MKKIVLLAFVAVVCASGVYGYFVFTDDSPLRNISENSTTVNEAPVVQPPQNSNGTVTYKDTEFNFSLTYPNTYRIGKFTEEEQTVFVLQSEEGAALQVVVSSFDEPDSVLTEARVRQDIPDMLMESARTVVLPAAKVQALAFETTSESFGKSIEVWFVHKGVLYQASTYAANAEFMQSVLGTLTFTNP